MSYATQSDMTERFGAVELAQLSDRVNGTVIDVAVVARALADADAEIDAYLARRYQLPLASTPPVLVRMACDIARYRLYDEAVTEAVRVRYNDAVALLKRMASGEVELPAATVLPAPATGSANAVLVRTGARQFGLADLSNY